MQYRPPMINQFRPPATTINPPSNMNGLDANGNPFSFPQQHPRFQPQLPQQPNLNPLQQQYQQNQFMNQYRLQPPPNMSQIPTTQPQSLQRAPAQTSTGSVNITDNKNWQDGLRALLPNINISFASKFKLCC